MNEQKKNNILIAFNHLLLHKAFDRITVEEIAAEAHVSRATFYRYFKDKYDVMNYNFARLLHDSFSTHKIQTMKDLFLVMLDFNYKVEDYYDQLFNVDGYNSLHLFIYNHSFEVAKNLYETGNIDGNAPYRNHMNEVQTLQLRVFCHGAAQFFEDWVKEHYDLTSNEAADALYDILPDFMKGDLSIS